VDGADALFTSVRVRIRHLDAWASLPGFTLAPDLPGKLTLAFEKPEVAPVSLASGACLALEQITGWKGPDACGGTLERQLWVAVLDMPPVSYRDIERTVVKPLMNLLTLSVSTECPVVGTMVSAGPDHPMLTVHSAAMKPAADAIIPLPRILLPLAEIGLEGVATWLDSVVRLGPLPSVVARAATSPDDTLETQLLELTTAAEGLHRLLLAQRKRMTDEQAEEARNKALEAIRGLLDDVRDAVKAALQHLTDQSYPRRLMDLAEHVGQAVPGVTGNTAQWKKRAVSTRINFAHALEHGFLNEDTAEESIAVLLSLRWLLTGLLLLQTGIDPATLGRRLDGHESYQLFLAQARTWLPAVYETGERPAQ
jgi:HEPN superfamily Apea-like protein